MRHDVRAQLGGINFVVRIELLVLGRARNNRREQSAAVRLEHLVDILGHALMSNKLSAT